MKQQPITDTIFYVESPLQLLCTVSQLQEAAGKTAIICRSSDAQTQILCDALSREYLVDIYSLRSKDLLKLFYGCLSSSIVCQTYGFGDPRSIFSFVLFVFFKPKEVLMFDDGGYSIHLDDGGSPELNTRWFGIKRKYIAWLIGRVTTRVTLFRHRITLGWPKIEVASIDSVVRGLGDINLAWPHKIHSNKEYLIFVETSLTGWLTRDGEEKVFTYLTSYAKKQGKELVVLSHRRTQLDRLFQRVSGFECNVYKLKFPFEFYLATIDRSNIELVCSLTSAAFTSASHLTKAKLSVFDFSREVYDEKRRAYAEWFFHQINTICRGRDRCIHWLTI